MNQAIRMVDIYDMIAGVKQDVIARSELWILRDSYAVHPSRYGDKVIEVHCLVSPQDRKRYRPLTIEEEIEYQWVFEKYGSNYYVPQD